MLKIRPFEATDADYEAFAALEVAVWPDFPDTVEEWKHRDEAREPQYLFQRFLAELEGRVVADGVCLEPWWSAAPGKYYLQVNVHPDYRRQGIGTAVWNNLTAVVNEHDPALLVSNTREDHTDAVRFLTRRGFRQVMRYPTSKLDVLGFDPEPFAGTVAEVEEQGIEILPLALVAAADPDWKRKYYDLDWELLQDVPSPEPLTRTSFESFEKRLFDSPSFTPDGQFIALDEQQWVGMSGLWLAQGDPEKLFTGLTGVIRSHRRRGIATALKVRAIAFAQQYGATVVVTDKEENNPMYLLNLKLGFEPQPAFLDFEKRLREGGEGN